MKTKLFFIVVFIFPVILCFSFFCQPAKAEVSGGSCDFCHVINLEPGWNVFSVPRLVASHQFSIAETNENFDIFLLDNTKLSGWATMADLGQTEFTPLFGYFINNKASTTQTLTINYKEDVEPSQRLFDRILTAGWNVIGIADPTDALRQKENNSTDVNNIQPILSSFADNIDLLLDFTADQSDKSSVKIGDSWTAKTPDNFNDLNDLRETKAYAVYVKTPGTYHGFQDNDEVRIFDPVSVFNLQSETKSANEKTANVDLMDFSVNTGYPINFSFNKISVELWSYHMDSSDVSNLKLICNGEEKIVVSSPVIGFNDIIASSSLPAGFSQCKITVDIGDINQNDNIQATIKRIE